MMKLLLLLLICFTLAGCEEDGFNLPVKCINGVEYEKYNGVWYAQEARNHCLSDEEVKKIEDK